MIVVSMFFFCFPGELVGTPGLDKVADYVVVLDWRVFWPRLRLVTTLCDDDVGNKKPLRMKNTFFFVLFADDV